MICKRYLFERGGEGMTVTTLTFGIEIFVAWRKSRFRYFSTESCKRNLRREVEIAALWTKNYCAQNLHKKIKATNLQVLRFRNKIEAHHIAQLYDRLKQFCCLSVQTLDSMSVVDAGFLLLLPPALSPAAALLLAQRGSPSQVKSEVQTLAHTFYPPKKVAPPLIRVANVFSLNSPQRVSIEGEFCADFKNVQKD